jgi:hypothetical protein
VKIQRILRQHEDVNQLPAGAENIREDVWTVQEMMNKVWRTAKKCAELSVSAEDRDGFMVMRRKGKGESKASYFCEENFHSSLVCSSSRIRIFAILIFSHLLWFLNVKWECYAMTFSEIAKLLTHML